tara:strand:+ start:377 stop:661 length:285 start_codon:yes stop_codon:yes gene_type:complete
MGLGRFYRRHSKQRAQERYGLLLTDEELEFIVMQIRLGRADKLGKTEDGKGVYSLVVCDGKRIKVMYDPRINMVATVLPRKSRGKRTVGTIGRG